MSRPCGRGEFPRTLVLTGHFPPGRGGVERFTAEIVSRLPSDRVVVMAPRAPGSAEIDAALPFPVHRYAGHVTANPRVAWQAREVFRAHNCDAAWFSSGIPLGGLAPALRRAGADRIVVTTHGLEAGWAALPVVRAAVRRVSQAIDVVTVLGDYTRAAIVSALHPDTNVVQLSGAVDSNRFRPGVDPAPVRARHGLEGHPVVVSVARLVRRKGHDALLAAWPDVVRCHPDAVVVLVGDGYRRASLERQARRLGIERRVVFAGTVPDADLPSYLASADLHVLPSRTQLGGMSIEGLGLTTLEASACGLPVIAGDSGGARDAVLDGVTGLVIDCGGREGPRRLAWAINDLLADPSTRQVMGLKGRLWVTEAWSWEAMTDRLLSALCRTTIEGQ